MSLINDMLKDLENKPRRLLSQDQTMVDLKSTLALRLNQNRQSYIIVSVMAALLAFLLSHYHFKNTDTREAPSKIAPAPISEGEKNLSADIPSGHTMLSGIAMQVQQDNTFLRFLINQNTVYRLSENTTRNELNIIFENTTLTAALPKMNYTGSGIENIEAYQDNAGNLKMVLKLSPGAELTRLDLNKDGKAPELQMEVYYSGIETPHQNAEDQPATIPVTIKKPVLESQSEQLLHQALSLSNSGHNADAIILLNQLLASTPTYKDARKELVSILIHENKMAEAKKNIDLGLKLQPENTDLVELAARILVDENKTDRAIKLLEQSAPTLAQNPDYHALIAALYQRQGKDTLAANLYKQLLNLDPSNAKWWLGLGVALDGAGDKSESLEAFAKADTIGGLNPELKAYIDSRLQTG